MHEYKCNNDESGCEGTFLTGFAPRFDPPAFCPNCGLEEHTEYVGIKQTGNPTPELDEMQRIVEAFDKCKYSSGGYSLSDLEMWLEFKFTKLADLITDVRMELDK